MIARRLTDLKPTVRNLLAVAAIGIAPPIATLALVGITNASSPAPDTLNSYNTLNSVSVLSEQASFPSK